MFSKNLRIFLSEITLASLIIQIFFSSISNTYAVNPGIHETIQTHSATAGYSFTMSGTTYLAIGN